MPEDKELVPLEHELESTRVSGDAEFESVIAKLSEAMSQAAGGFFTQNLQGVEIAGLTADALYDKWKGHGTPTSSLFCTS